MMSSKRPRFRSLQQHRSHDAVMGWGLSRVWGAGVMNGGRTVTRDTCLYAEDYAFRLARERTNGTRQTAIVVRTTLVHRIRRISILQHIIESVQT